MSRSMIFQWIILGIGLSVMAVMWIPDHYLTTIRNKPWRLAYTLAVLMILFMVPAFRSVFEEIGKRGK